MVSSLTTCSGQRGGGTGKGNEKECVVEDIGNKSSQVAPPGFEGFGLCSGWVDVHVVCYGGGLSVRGDYLE